jgi:putative transposase
MGRQYYRINLMESEEKELQRLVGKQSTPQAIAKRARIILWANGEGWKNSAISVELRIDKQEVGYWLKRWIERGMDPVEVRLRDQERPGRPSEISAEQWCRIMALACEPPENHGRPISHWTSRELAEEAIRQGIVAALSEGHLRKFLKKRSCSRTVAAIG